MKTALVVLGFTVALSASLSAQTVTGLKGERPEAGSVQRASSRNLHPSRILVVKSRKQPPQTYYLTNLTVTGSAIPVVIRQYKGHNQPLDSGFRRNDVYTGTPTGEYAPTDLASGLRKLDPSFF